MGRRRVRGVATMATAALVLVGAGCNRYGYDARIEHVEVSTSFVNIAGWYRDPYLTKRSACAETVLLVDGVVRNARGSCGSSLGLTPDVDGAAAAGGIGFRQWVYGLSKGRHELCVHVVPLGADLPAQPNHCTQVDVPWDQFSQGVIDSATISGGQLTVEGWFSHVPFTLVSGQYTPTWQVDGQWIRSTTPGAVITEVDRPDVVAAVGPTGKGYRLTMPITPAAPGLHTVCIGLDNGFGAGNAAICRFV